MRILILFLLAPLSAFTQSNPYYLAGGLSDFNDQQFRQTSPVFVTRIGEDSIVISTSGDSYQYASEYKRNPGESFLRRTRTWSDPVQNYAFLYTKAVVLVEESGSFLIFLDDKQNADVSINSNDQSFSQHLKDSLCAIVKAINSGKRAEKDRLVNATNKRIVTAYMRGESSKRTDPTLVRDIKKWSNNETTTVYILDANYTINRNYRGEILNKSITGIIKYQLDGKCYIQWRCFGYEALGGGVFSKDMDTFNRTDYFIQANGAGGSVRLEEGVPYEIDCN